MRLFFVKKEAFLGGHRGKHKESVARSISLKPMATSVIFVIGSYLLAQDLFLLVNNVIMISQIDVCCSLMMKNQTTL